MGNPTLAGSSRLCSLTASTVGARVHEHDTGRSNARTPSSQTLQTRTDSGSSNPRPLLKLLEH
jgi:hypothetical protein